MIEKFKLHLLMERNLSKNTVNSYNTDIKQLINSISKSIETINSNDISQFIITLKEKGCSTSTTNRKLSAIKTFFRYLVRQKVIPINPAAEIEGGKKEQRLPQTIEEDIVSKLINTTDCLRDRLIIELLFGTGARREELCKIKLKDINFTKKYIKLFGKGNKERLVPVYPAALDTASKLIGNQDGEWLFPAKKKNGHICVRQINRIVEKYVKKLNLDKDITPHKFRHTVATILFSKGMDLKVLQEFLGHSSPATTSNIYTKTSIERNLKEYKLYHPKSCSR